MIRTAASRGVGQYTKVVVAAKPTKAKVQARAYSGDTAHRDQYFVDYPQTYKDAHKKIVIVGGGTGGLALANRLAEQYEWINMTIVEPSREHFYQPGWTLAGAGEINRNFTKKWTKSYIPSHANWINDRVIEFDPENNRIKTAEGEWVNYDVLAVSMGIECKWDKIKGLTEAIGVDNVTSNYSYETCGYTWDLIQNFKGGNALFTQPATPIKCGGAPQKIMFMAEDHWENRSDESNVRRNANIEFLTGTPTQFVAPAYAEILAKECEEKDIKVNLKHDLVEIRSETNEAVFKAGDNVVVKQYDFLHVTPPQGPPAIVSKSPLADEAGWMDVDKTTLQSTKYPNVFGLGDCTNIPTSKTAAAVSAQYPVVANNIMSYVTGAEKTTWDAYDGFTGCPIPTGASNLLMATFKYGAELYPDSDMKPSWYQYLVKKYAFPFLYWNFLLKGTWEGPHRWRSKQLASWRKHWKSTVVAPKVEFEKKDAKLQKKIEDFQTYTEH